MHHEGLHKDPKNLARPLSCILHWVDNHTAWNVDHGWTLYTPTIPCFICFSAY